MATRRRRKNNKKVEEEVTKVVEEKSEEKQEKKEIVELPPKKKHTKEEIDAATKKAEKDTLKEILPYIIIIICVIIIRSFIATPVDVNGDSMNPTLKDGDIMLLYKLRLKTVGINRFDIVVISTDDGKLIKRVIGLPGDTVRYEIDEEKQKGILYINDEVVEENFSDDAHLVQTCKFVSDLCLDGITVPEDEYFVMGDNRGNSKDSRMLGTIEKEDIQGITSIVLFPFNRFGNVNK